ncbi:MAG: transposase [Candidatus Rokuibacteriota bacterium]
MAELGDLTRFDTPRQLMSYLGLDAAVRRSHLTHR